MPAGLAPHDQLPRRYGIALLFDRALQQRREGKLFFVGQVKVQGLEMRRLTNACQPVLANDGRRAKRSARGSSVEGTARSAQLPGTLRDLSLTEERNC
jgi:hypothetical protein